MKFLMNNQSWEIKEVPEDSGKLFVQGSFHQGSTHFDTQTLYLLDSLTKDRKREVLMHELTHCILYATQVYYQKDSFSEEEVCELMALYGAKAADIMREYFRVKELKK